MQNINILDVLTCSIVFYCTPRDMSVHKEDPIVNKISLIVVFFIQVPFLDKLKSGETIIGDGSLTFTLERRGYVTATDWTPEAVVEYPDAGIVSHIVSVAHPELSSSA